MRWSDRKIILEKLFHGRPSPNEGDYFIIEVVKNHVNVIGPLLYSEQEVLDEVEKIKTPFSATWYVRWEKIYPSVGDFVVWHSHEEGRIGKVTEVVPDKKSPLLERPKIRAQWIFSTHPPFIPTRKTLIRNNYRVINKKVINQMNKP